MTLTETTCRAVAPRAFWINSPVNLVNSLRFLILERAKSPQLWKVEIGLQQLVLEEIESNGAEKTWDSLSPEAK